MVLVPLQLLQALVRWWPEKLFCRRLHVDVGGEQAVEYGATLARFKVEHELAEAFVVVSERENGL